MKTKVRCPYCVHDFEVEVTEAKADEKVLEKKLLEFDKLPTLLTSLQAENENLRWENQRLSIEQHRHRGE
jgi:uncharacterized Zn finger protein (UPF0148 family)